MRKYRVTYEAEVEAEDGIGAVEAALKDIIKHYDDKEMDSKNEDVVRRPTRSSRKTLGL
mgnify:CR=1 FL=1